MYPDPHFNPLLPFKESTELSFFWRQYLLPNSKSILYSTSVCRILIQEIRTDTHVVWYMVFNSSNDDLMIKMVLPPQLLQLLIYNVQNNGEMIFLHHKMGIGISEMDYCYMGGTFTDKDLRILLSKGTYQTVFFPFFQYNKRSSVTLMQMDETYAFIGKNLMNIGISLIS
jgi:hypothetical protein